MFSRRQRPGALLVVAALVWATAGIPTPRPTELIACPYQSYCLPRTACQSSKVTFDAKHSNVLDSEARNNGALTVKQNDFACGVLQPSADHVCCSATSGGFLPSGRNWLPNAPPSAPAVTPWQGFLPNTANEDGYLRVKNLSKTGVLPNVNPAIVGTRRSLTGFKAIVFPGEVFEENGFRSAQQNTKGWSCGEVLSASSLNETYTAEERLINQGDHPWQVAVLTAGMRYMCGGALVGSRTVLTLASCIRDVAGDQLLVRVGDQDLSSNREPLPAYDVPVDGIALHPAFDPSSRQFDLAILQLQHSLSSLPYVRGACLPLPNQNFSTTLLDYQLSEQFSQLFLHNLTVAPDLTHCHLASWGLEAEEQGTDGSFSYILRGGQFYILSRDVCQAILGRTENLSSGERCAAGYGGTAICRGGGGSALVCRAGDRFVLEGIVARSTRCTRDSPLVYIKISDHLNFILDHLKLRSPKIEKIIQPVTSSYQGSNFNSNEKTGGISDGKTLNKFNLPGQTGNGNSVDSTKNSAKFHGSKNDVFEGFPEGAEQSLIKGGPHQGNGGRGIPIESLGNSPLQIPSIGVPEIGFSTVNNIGNNRERLVNVQSDVSQSSFFQFADVIGPGVSGQQKQSGSNLANTNLAETNTIINGSGESDEVHSGQAGSVFISSELVAPQTAINQKDNTYGLSDGFSSQTSDDIQNILINAGAISISKGVVVPPKTIIVLGDHDFTNSVPNRDGSLLDLDEHNSDIRGSFILDNVFGHRNGNFRPSTIRSPTTQQAPERKFIGSFIDDSQVNLPHAQSVGRTDFHDWRPPNFQNSQIPSRRFLEYNPINVPNFSRGRKYHFQMDQFSVPLLPHRGYHTLPSPYPRPLPIPPPPRFHPSIGSRHFNMASFPQSYTPLFKSEPLPNPPPFFNEVADTPPQRVESSVVSLITSDQTPSSLQPDTLKAEVSEINGKEESEINLNKVQQYLSRYQ